MSDDEQYSIDFLKRMLEIYSPSGKEDKISYFLLSEMKIMGFKNVRRDEVGNVYGEIGFGEPTVLLCSHMDTVPGWIPVKVEGDRIYGRGAVDAKSSLAAMIIAAASLKQSIPNGRIIVACVVDEERKGRGIKRLIRERLNVDYAIFGEPSGIKNITFAYKGHLKLRITCKTRTGHVGAQHLIPNAVEKCLEIWNKIKNLCEEKYKSPYGIFYSLTPAIIGINGRGTTGSIPDVCVISIDLRLPPTIDSQKAINIVNDLVEGFKRENQGLTIDLKVIDRVEPFVADRNTLVTKALKEAIFKETGEEAKFIRKTGTGDMNIFGAHFREIPVATYGPGDSNLSHSLNEQIDVQEYLVGIKIYKRTVEKILES
ncbi:MAG: M20/M25/M40 family metallo-hydrolase [Candidatus Bathyarchaeia archaeon]|nr:M20/M25/M40 family metallo-hydrolase [Candidatus Bathyarchaeota archaeon]